MTETITPKAAGFTMPAEWAPHGATWMAWPFDDDMWHGELPAVRREYGALVRAVADREPVQLVVRDGEALGSAQAALAGLAGVTYHQRPLDDVWMRDNGPTFVTKGGEVAMVDWRFNAWGEKYDWALDDQIPPYVAKTLGLRRFVADVVMEGGSIETNGEGLCLTTAQCLLEPGRNPGRTRRDLEGILGDYLGFEQVIWLEEGLEGDHTDGHIDTITRFAGPRTIITSVAHDHSDRNHQTLAANLARLRQATWQGAPLKIVELPIPVSRRYLADGTRLPLTYANFYLCNGAVLVPLYDDPMDDRAMAILKDVFANREVVGLPSRYIITGGGSFHCLTQQQPRA